MATQTVTVTGVGTVDNTPADPNTGNVNSGSPYKSYTASLRHSGTSNPTTIEL